VNGGSAQIAVLGRPGYRPARRAEDTAPLVRLTAFGALALYGTLRWSTLLSSGGTARLLALWALAVLLAGARRPVARRSRVAAALFTVLVLVLALAVSGIPLSWLWHVRLALSIRAVGDGLSALPQISVPYAGADAWVRLDIVLGAAILLFDAALLLAFAPRGIEDLRCVGVALPLVALAAVPLTAVHAGLPYVDGVVLFALLAAFVWADWVGRRQAAGAFLLCLGAGTLATALAPALDRHRAWIDYQALAGSLTPKAVESFNWSQGYGPIDWPRHGRTVLEIEARRPEYWKTEDLDVFDGRGWTQGVVPGDENTPPPSPAALERWSETVRVNVRALRSADVIGAGVARAPTGFPHPVMAGFSAGTWTTGTDLVPGDSYTIPVYAPNPTPSQLSRAHAGYAGVPAGYRTILLAGGTVAGSGATAQVVFATFHSGRGVENVFGPPSRADVIDRSPYAGVYRLARRLARASSTPFAFVASVERYLAQGYIYDENPPSGAYPLASFLLRDRRGYCQHFAGAMALLLRMGGVPARVSVGFTQGRQGASPGKWLVSDSDAHAWVEAWFPQYGWVKFDPTPPADPALGGRGAADAVSSIANVRQTLQPTGHIKTPAAVRPRPRPSPSRASSSVDAGALAAGAGAVAVVLLALSLLLTRPLASADALVTELERALARTGRPSGGATTLAAIERRIGEVSAGEYVRVLRLARFGGRNELPTPRQRRALRRHLAGRGGPLRRLRALWALPPRRRAPTARGAGARGSRGAGAPGSRGAPARSSRTPRAPES
jgi:Transglutaminase-like superfamily